MELTKKTLVKGGFYTFLIALALLVISHALGIDDYGNYRIMLNVKLYLACTLCGYLIALADLIFVTKLDPIIKRALHFVILLAGFVVVFATNGSGSGLAGRKVFIAVVLYVIAYAVIFLAAFGIKKLVSALMKKSDASSSSAKKPEEKYTPLYKK